MRDRFFLDTASSTVAGVITFVFLSLLTWLALFIFDNIGLVIVFVGVSLSLLLLCLSVTERSSTFLILGLFTFVVSLAISRFLPEQLCALKPLEPVVSYFGRPEIIKIEYPQLVQVESDSRIKIEILPLNRQDSTEKWECIWTSQGDGEFSDTSNCTTIFLVGLDRNYDIVSTDVRAPNCNVVKRESLVIQPVVAGE